MGKGRCRGKVGLLIDKDYGAKVPILNSVSDRKCVEGDPLLLMMLSPKGTARAAPGGWCVGRGCRPSEVRAQSGCVPHGAGTRMVGEQTGETADARTQRIRDAGVRQWWCLYAGGASHGCRPGPGSLRAVCLVLRASSSALWSLGVLCTRPLLHQTFLEDKSDCI